MKNSIKLVSISLALACTGALAADPATSNTAAQRSSAQAPAVQGYAPAVQGLASPDANNTGMNERDRNGATATPDKQTNQADDRKLLATVRSAVVKDKSLSTSAHNVKMLVQGGVVTLRGPVRSADEKERVAKHAQNIAGVTSVENQLDIKTN